METEKEISKFKVRERNVLRVTMASTISSTLAYAEVMRKIKMTNHDK